MNTYTLPPAAVEYLRHGQVCHPVLQIVEWCSGIPFVNDAWRAKANPMLYPLSALEFYLCELLLAHVPEWRERLPMAVMEATNTDRNPWCRLLPKWGEVVAILEQETTDGEQMAPHTTGKLLALFRA